LTFFVVKDSRKHRYSLDFFDFVVDATGVKNV